MGDGGQSAGVNSAGTRVDNSENPAIQAGEENQADFIPGAAGPGNTPFDYLPGAAVTKTTPLILIPGVYFSFTVSSQITVNPGLEGNPHFGYSVSDDGSVNVNTGGASASFSSDEALNDASVAVPGSRGVSVSPQGVSYTYESVGDVGGNRVTVDTTATFGPTTDLPPNVDLEGAGVVGGLGLLALGLGKLLCLPLPPGVDAACVLAPQT